MLPRIPDLNDNPDTPTGALVKEEQATSNAAPDGPASNSLPSDIPEAMPGPSKKAALAEYLKGKAFPMLAIAVGLVAILVSLSALSKAAQQKKLMDQAVAQLKADLRNLPRPKDFSADIAAIRTEDGKRIQVLETYFQQMLPRELQKFAPADATRGLEERITALSHELGQLRSLQEAIRKQERNWTNVVQILRNHDRAITMIYESTGNSEINTSGAK